jgi:hypothetical protein
MERMDGVFLFDPAIFDPAIFDAVEFLGLLEQLLERMEKDKFGDFCFEAGCVEPGVDNCNVPLRRILSNME